MSHRIHLFLAGAIGGLCSAAAQTPKSFSCTTSITADLTNGFSQPTAKVLKGGDGCLITLLSGEVGTNIAVYQDISINKDCGDSNNGLNTVSNYLGAGAPFFEDPTVLCIVNTDNNAIIDTNKMLTVNLVEDGLPGDQPDNTMQAYTSTGFDQTTDDGAKTADGTCRTLTWPADVEGGIIQLAVDFDCTDPPGTNVKAGTDEAGCENNEIGAGLNYFHEYGAYQYEPFGHQPVFFYVKCSAAGGGGGGAQEDAANGAAAVEADAAESEDLSVESASDDSDDETAIIGGAIGGVAVLAIGMGLWYRTRTAAKYKLVI